MTRSIFTLLFCVVSALMGAASIYSSSSSAAGTSGPWGVVPPMSVARAAAAAVTLQSGTVLVAGGTSDGIHAIAEAELYDPSQSNWLAAAPLNTGRSDFTATRLSDGSVLAVGGLNGVAILDSVELYDPGKNSWTATAPISTARHGQVAILLRNGHVLVAGGAGAAGPLTSAEVYDPQKKTWTTAAAMSTPRIGATATALPDGRVLVAGGSDGAQSLASAEVYDPASNVWTATGSMAASRAFHTATSLSDGRVLVAGGFSGTAATATAEIYSPSTGKWTTTGALAAGRGQAVSATLPDGRILVSGGAGSTDITATALATSEIFDPATGTWTSGGTMHEARADARVATLPGGQILVVGGRNGAQYLSGGDLYTPESPPTATASPTAPQTTDTPFPTSTSTPTVTPVAPSATPIGTALTVTATPTPTVPQLRYRIVAVRVERNTGKPDWQRKHPVLRSIRQGQTVQLSTYVQFGSMVAGAHVAVSTQARLGARTVHRAGAALHLSADDTGGFWAHTSFKPSQRGQYTVDVTVTIDAESRHASATWTVLPPVARPVKFTFDSLRIHDESGRTIMQASAGQRVNVVATWTLTGQQSSVPVRLTETLQTPAGSKWKTLGAPLRTAFDAVSGTRSFTFSFVPAGSYASIRILIDMSAAGTLHRRSVLLRLQH
jgi:N-acetylneuraminic acid mutarotase